MSKLEGLELYTRFENSDVLYTPNYGALPVETKTKIEPQLVEAAAIAFNRSPEQFGPDVIDHLNQGDLYVVMTEGASTGFAVLENFPDQGAIYIAGIAKRRPAPSRIIEHIIETRLDQNGFEVVTVRTQNDRVAEIMANTCRQVVAMDELATPSHVDILNQMGLIKDPSALDPKLLVQRGYYGGPMIASGERRRSANYRVTSLTDKLNYLQGDALLMVGYRK